MTATQYAANMARTFMAAELAMASVNCGAPIVTRAQAERLLDEYFALVEQAIPSTEERTTLWTDAPESERRSQAARIREYALLGQSLCAPTKLSGSFRAQPAQFPPD